MVRARPERASVRAIETQIHLMTRTAALSIFVIALAGLTACASRKSAPPAPSAQNGVVVRPVPSAQPTATGAPLSTHAPYAITAGLDGNLWFTEYQGDGVGRVTP